MERSAANRTLAGLVAQNLGTVIAQTQVAARQHHRVHRLGHAHLVAFRKGREADKGMRHGAARETITVLVGEHGLLTT